MRPVWTGHLVALCAVAIAACASVDVDGVRVDDCIADVPNRIPASVNDRCFVAEATAGSGAAASGFPAGLVLAAAVDDHPVSRDDVEAFAATLVFRRSPDVVAVDKSPRPAFAWRTTASGLHHLHWSNGFTGGSMCLRDDGLRLRGEASLFNCVTPPPPAVMQFIEVPCAAPLGTTPPDDGSRGP